MTQENKERAILGAKVVALFVVALIGIAASAGSLNFGYVNHEGFYSFVGTLNFGIVAFADWSLYKYLFKKPTKK